MYAAISSGHVDLAEALYLVAFLIFVVAALVAVWKRTPELGLWLVTALIAAGLACVALALLVL